MKAKAAEDRKLTVAANCAESLPKKQEKQELLLSAAEAKAAKAVAKAKELRSVVAKTSVLTTEPVTPHSHKKSKGNAGLLLSTLRALSFTNSLCSRRGYLPSRELVSTPLSVSLLASRQLPGSFLSPEGSYLSDSSGDLLVVGNDASGDTDNDHEPISFILSSCRDILFWDKQSVACGGRCYGSPLSKDCVSLKAPPKKAYSWPQETLNASLSSGSWTDNVNDIDMSLESDTLVGRSSPCTVKLTTLFGTNNLPVPLGLIGRRQIFATVSGQDHTPSPCSPTLSCVTLQVTGWLTCTFHTGWILNLWNNQARKFALMNGCC